MSESVDLSNVSLQQDVLMSRPRTPDARSTLYITSYRTADANGATNETVVGVEVVLKKDDPNGLWNRLHVGRKATLDPASPKVATSSLLIACDTLIVHGGFCLPEANVSIFARRIVWATDDAAIITTPLSWTVAKATNATRSSDAGNGANGRDAGALAIFVAEAGPAGAAVKRLQAEGGRGQDPGDGLDGEDGSRMSSWSSRTRQSKEWISGEISKGTANFDPPAIYIDFELYWTLAKIHGDKEGSDSFPTDGTDARAAGRPGCGGNGGAFTTNLAALQAALANQGAPPGTRGRDYRGGTAGQPQNAGKYRMKMWHNVFGTDNAKVEIDQIATYTSKAGADGSSPPPDRGAGQTPAPKVLQITNAWLHPLGLQRTLAYARDLLLADSRAPAHELLSAYDKALAGAPPGNDAWDAQDAAQWTAAQSEVASMLQRLAAHLDYFGNRAGYTPLLSLPGMVTLYAEETRRALKTQLLAEWIAAKARDTKALASALTTTIDNLNDDTKAAAAQIVSAEAAITGLTGDLDALEHELGDLGHQLEVLRNQLLSQVENDERVKGQIKFGIHMLAAICQVVPVGQPVLGTLGTLAGHAADFVGGDEKTAPDTISKIGDTIGKARKAAKKAEEAKKKAEKEKAKEKPKDDKEAKSEASAWATAGDGLGSALSEVSDGLKSLQVSKDEVDAQLQRLQSENKAWKKLIDKIAALNERKAKLFEGLTSALQTLGESYGRVSANAAAVVSMQQRRNSAAATLDPAATGFVRDMGQRSRLTLLKYLYLMVRAYETTVMKPIDVDWQLTTITQKISELIQQPGELDAAQLLTHVKALAPIFEDNLDLVRQKLLVDFHFNEVTTPLRLVLTQRETPDALDALNQHGTIIINPLRIGLILPDQQLARLSNVTLKSVVFDPEGPRLPDANNMVITLPPAQRGTLRRGAGLFAVYSDEPMRWSWTWFGPNDVRASKPSQGAEDMLNLILGAAGKDIRQKVALPPAWSDLSLRVQISPPLPPAQRPRIAELQFELNCDQTPAPDNQKVLIVQSLGEVPGAVVDCSTDLGKRAAGLNQMLRVYSKGAKVRLQVPGLLGGATFEGWDLLGGSDPLTCVRMQTVEVDMSDDVLARCHWSVAGPRVTILSVAHALPAAEFNALVEGFEDTTVRHTLRRSRAAPPPLPDRLLRAEPKAASSIIGLVPAGVEPTVLETGAEGWQLAVHDGVAGWMAP